jgi:2-polyprenyl-3-methyl-5-hydroxy-6-metoxy-1,4-benzoquinol methylase
VSVKAVRDSSALLLRGGDAVTDQLRLLESRQACPACGTDDAQPIFGPVPYDSPPVQGILQATHSGQMDWRFLGDYLRAAEYCLLRCPRCTLIWQRDVPIGGLLDVLLEDLSPARLAEYRADDLDAVRERIAVKLDRPAVTGDGREWRAALAGHGADGDRTARREKNYTTLAQQIIAIANFFGRPRVRVLDFGMGQGEWCRVAAALGMEAFGLEYSDEKASWRVAGGYQVISPPALEEHRFDFINTEQVFEHLNQPLPSLRRLAGRLQPGGLIRIAVPNGYGIEGRLRDARTWTAMKGEKSALGAVRPLRHINCYSGRSLTQMAEHAGLRRVDLGLGLRLRSATGFGGVMKAPASWVLRRVWPARYTTQYYAAL